MDRKRSRAKKIGGKDGMPAPSIEEIERNLREGVVVSMERNLAGTGYWGRAEAESADAISAEKDPKRKKAMIRRYEELAVQLKDLSITERERILLEEIENWKKESQQR